MAKHRLSIVHCLSPAAYGGLESVVEALAAGQRDRGHSVTIFATVSNPAHPFIARMGNLNIDVFDVLVSSKDIKKERRFFAETIKSLSPDVIHSHGYRPDILDIPIARKLGIPTVSTVHGFTGGDWKLKIYEMLQMRALRQASAVVAVSRNVAERLRQARVPEPKVHVIPNAYSKTAQFSSPQDRQSARQKLGISQDETRIGWIGRISEEKGLDIMIEAAGLFKDQSIILSVIGDGAEYDKSLSKAAALGISNRVIFHGSLQNAGDLLPAFDLLALSSRTEGTPMVILEAMGRGIPVVSTAVGGIPDMLSDQEAILVPPNDPPALARAIEESLSFPAAARERAQSALKKLQEKYGTESWLDAYERLYLSLS